MSGIVADGVRVDLGCAKMLEESRREFTGNEGTGPGVVGVEDVLGAVSVEVW